MKNYKIVFLDEYTVSDSDLSPIKKLGDYTGFEITDPEQIVERCAGAQIVVTNKSPMTDEVIEALPELKLICVAATGTNNVDMEAARRAGVVVKNAKDYSTHAVAESTIMGALTLLKQTLYYDNFVKSGDYIASPRLFDFGRPTYQLHGKNWGIIGLGNIGRRVAELAAALGCNVSYYSTTGNNNNAAYQQKDLDHLLADSDILSIHAPLSETTRNMLDYHQFSLMQPTAIVINVARGPIINEDGLARALNDNLIAGAALDVYSQEPMRADNPICKVKDKYRLVLTPHSAWSTKESLQVLVEKVAENIKEYIAKGQ